MLYSTNEKIFLWVNEHNSPFFDFLFTKITHLGHIFSYLLLLIVLFFSNIKIRFFLAAIVAVLTTSFIVQSLKIFFFRDALRPVYLSLKYDLHLLNQIILKKSQSFPSGHSAIAYTMGCFIILHLKPNHIFIIIILILASLVSYSRIYLAQHFYKDIYFGALIGGISAWCTYEIMKFFNFSTFLNNPTNVFYNRIFQIFKSTKN